MVDFPVQLGILGKIHSSHPAFAQWLEDGIVAYLLSLFHFVAERLGHRNVSITLEIYAHALPSMQREAADQISSLIGG